MQTLLLVILFNSMLHFGYVSSEFGNRIIIPVVKDKCDDVSSSNNYRGITLSSSLAKLFKMCVLEVYGNYLSGIH